MCHYHCSCFLLANDLLDARTRVLDAITVSFFFFFLADLNYIELVTLKSGSMCKLSISVKGYSYLIILEAEQCVT